MIRHLKNLFKPLVFMLLFAVLPAHADPLTDTTSPSALLSLLPTHNEPEYGLENCAKSKATIISQVGCAPDLEGQKPFRAFPSYSGSRGGAICQIEPTFQVGLIEESYFSSYTIKSLRHL